MNDVGWVLLEDQMIECSLLLLCYNGNLRFDLDCMMVVELLVVRKPDPVYSLLETA